MAEPWAARSDSRIVQAHPILVSARNYAGGDDVMSKGLEEALDRIAEAAIALRYAAADCEDRDGRELLLKVADAVDEMVKTTDLPALAA